MGLKTSRIFLIYAWHTLFCILSFWYSVNFVSDAVGYYEAGNMGGYNFGLGTEFIEFFSVILTAVFGLSFLGNFLFFNIFGVIGLMAFDSSLQSACKLKGSFAKRLSVLIVFLPSISFWSSALGKDAISFMAICLALWALLNFERRATVLLFSILCMLMIRPHIAGVMILTLLFSLVFASSISWIKRLYLLLPVLFSVVVLVPFLIDFAGLGDISDFSEVSDFVETRQSYNLEGGGGIDISSLTYPEQLFAYMFRPTIFEISNIFSLAAALDNLILLCIFIVAVFNLRKGVVRLNKISKIYIFTYLFVVWSIFAMTTSNMGIALRQKWMFAPMLIYICISYFKDINLNKVNR